MRAPCLLLLLLALPLLAACEVRGPSTLPGGSLCDPAEPSRCEGPEASCLPLDGDGRVGICTHACRVDGQCPGGLVCQLQTGGREARCMPGFRCGADTDCPTGHRCDPESGSCFIPVRRGFCSPCSADAQCPVGGACVTARATGERFCATACTAGTCPIGQCQQWEGGWYCMPPAGTCEERRPLCAPCVGDSQCGDGNDLCMENFRSGERFCGLSCNPECSGPGCACPDSFRCADLSGVGEGPFQCVPTAASCADSDWCATDAGCPMGQACDGGEHRCVPATDGRSCAPCADDDDCAGSRGSRCLEGPEGSPFCAPPCGEGGACAVGFACVEVEGSPLCVPASGSCEGGTGRLGQPCGDEGAAGCISGLCLLAGETSYCSGGCSDDADCGEAGWQCCAIAQGSGGSRSWDCTQQPAGEGGVCAPRGGLFGDSCEAGRAPCQDGHCLDLGASRICTADCIGDIDCDSITDRPGSFECKTARLVGQGGTASEKMVRICFPAGGGEIGSDCTFGPAACADQLCITKESGNICSATCTHQDDCPEGWSCGSTTTVDGRRVSLCLPPSVG